jgi:hypothetical protein
MKKSSIGTILVGLLCLNTFAAADKTVTEHVSAFFISESGHCVTNFHEVSGAMEIKGGVDGNDVVFEIMNFDPINDIAVLAPRVPIEVEPVHLLLGELDVGEPVVNISILEDGKRAPTPLVIQGKVQSLTGMKGDIRYIKLEFPWEYFPNGPVFDMRGLCVGLISNRITDMYAFLQTDVTDITVSFAKKVDYLFPLVKQLPGVYWTEDDADVQVTPAEITETSLIPLEVKRRMTARKLHDIDEEDFTLIRSRLPSDALFISVSVSSGYDNVGFVNLLLDTLEKEKIGRTVDPMLKQKYYRSIYERYGFPDLTADELVKMAADLANGYYVEAGCNIVSGEIEDSVTLKLYEKRSVGLLADIRAAKVVDTDPAEAVKDLTLEAVKKLKNDLEDIRPSLIGKK